MFSRFAGSSEVINTTNAVPVRDGVGQRPGTFGAARQSKKGGKVNKSKIRIR